MWRSGLIGRRCFSSLAAPEADQSILDKIFSRSSMPRIPLDVPVQHVVKPEEIKKHPVQISTLDNGLRVVSRSSQSPIATVGVFVDSGSRYEVPGINGISHFMEYLAFGSTTKQADYAIVREMLKIGANLACTTSREHTVYVADCLREYVPNALKTLADVTQNPAFDNWELAEVRNKYKIALEDKLSKPDVQLVESLHAAAYHNNTVGLPLYPTLNAVDHFDHDILSQHFRRLYTPQRMVVSGVGIDHNELTGLVREHFTAPKVAKPEDFPKAQYTGGDVRSSDLDMPLTHFALAFETANWHSKDLVPMCVLQMMMGGGGSFSAGGPGKGMCSRLYTNVLNQHHWVESANCFTSIFSDTAIFGILGTCPPEQAAELVDVICGEFEGMKKIEGAELDRAKMQLKTSVQMQLETRSAQVEDLGRQLLTYNKVMSAEQLCSQIDAVTSADVQRVASAMLKTRPSVANIGNISHTPRYEQIAKRFG